MLSYLLTLEWEEDTLINALHHAFEGGSLQSVKLVLDAGADPVAGYNAFGYMKWACLYGTCAIGMKWQLNSLTLREIRSMGYGADPP
jgi:hypothetical protein